MGSEFLNWALSETPALKEISLEEVASRIREAVYRKHDPAGTPGYAAPLSASPALYVVDIFLDFVVVSKGDAFYKITYQATPEGIVVGDEMTRVIKTWAEVE